MNIKFFLISFFFFFILFLNVFCSKKNNTAAENKSEKLIFIKKNDSVSLRINFSEQCRLAGYYIAKEKGFFRDENLDVAFRFDNSDTNPLDTVSSGIDDFGAVSLIDLITAAAEGKSIIALAQIEQIDGLILISKKKKAITKKRPSKKKIILYNNYHQIQLKTFIKKYKKKIQTIELSKYESIINAFFNENTDYISGTTYNEYQQIINKNFSPDLLSIIDYSDYELEFPGQILFTNKNFIKNNSEIAQRFLRAVLRGWNYAVLYPNETVSIIIKNSFNNTTDKKKLYMQIKEMARLCRYSQSGNIGVFYSERINAAINIFAENNLISIKPILTNIIDTSFISNIITKLSF